MYCNVRYPVMRVDIGRAAILHCYGGMYADMDTRPNRSRYAEADLVVGRVDLGRVLLPAKNSWAPPKGKTHVLDMEVMIARRGNPLLTR